MPAVPAQAAEARRSRVKGQPVLLETLSKKKKTLLKTLKFAKKGTRLGMLLSWYLLAYCA